MEPWPKSLQHFHWSVLLFGGTMLDVKRIRNDFDALAEKLATRGVAAETLNELKELDVCLLYTSLPVEKAE